MNITKSILISLCIFNVQTNCDIVSNITQVFTQLFTQLYKAVMATISSFTRTRVNEATNKITSPINGTVSSINRKISFIVNEPMQKLATSTQRMTSQMKIS